MRSRGPFWQGLLGKYPWLVVPMVWCPGPRCKRNSVEAWACICLQHLSLRVLTIGSSVAGLIQMKTSQDFPVCFSLLVQWGTRWEKECVEAANWIVKWPTYYFLIHAEQNCRKSLGQEEHNEESLGLSRMYLATRSKLPADMFYLACPVFKKMFINRCWHF